MTGRKRLSHVSPNAAVRMVDVSSKPVSRRSATAEAWVDVGAKIAAALRRRGAVSKGNVLETARLAGIMGAKRTPDLIPLCHPLVLEGVDIQARLIGRRVRIVASAWGRGRTGVEMEAMTAAAVAALTVYDMVKSAGKEVQIGVIRLLEKRGGKSGHWRRGLDHG